MKLKPRPSTCSPARESNVDPTARARPPRHRRDHAIDATRQLDGVAVWVSRRSIRSARPRLHWLIRAQVLEDMLNTGLDKNKPRLFDPKEYVQTYTTCYNMCTQRSPYNWSEQLYQRHGETICDYLSKTVLPALKQKSGNALLTELTVRWSNHKIMNKWMRLFFMYLDRYYVKHHSLPTLDVAGLKHFKTLVYNEVKKDVVNAMIALIDAERDQALIDRALVKNTVELLEAMGMGSLDAYVTDFEDQLLASTKEYYARKSQEWVESDDAYVYRSLV